MAKPPMLFSVTLRGSAGGGYNLQTRIVANNADEALARAISRWGLERAELTRIHVQQGSEENDRERANLQP